MLVELLVYPGAQMPVHAVEEKCRRAVGERTFNAKGTLKGLEDMSLIKCNLEACGVDKLISKAGEADEIVGGFVPLGAGKAAVVEEAVFGIGGDCAGKELVLADAQHRFD